MIWIIYSVEDNCVKYIWRWIATGFWSAYIYQSVLYMHEELWVGSCKLQFNYTDNDRPVILFIYIWFDWRWRNEWKVQTSNMNRWSIVFCVFELFQKQPKLTYLMIDLSDNEGIFVWPTMNTTYQNYWKQWTVISHYKRYGTSIE